jgi:hypothetical protein
MRTTFLISLSLFLLGTICSAQNPNLDFKVAAKVSNLTTYQTGEIGGSGLVSGQPMRLRYFQAIHLVPAVVWMGRKGLWNEVSVIQANWEETKGNGVFDSTPFPHSARSHRLQNVVFSAQYGKFLPFFRKKDTHWVPMLGVELRSSYAQVNQVPTFLNDYTFRRLRGDLWGYLTPRLSWFPSKRCFADLSLKVQCFDLILSQSKDISGNRPAEIATRHGAEIYFLNPVFAASVGFGYKF